MSVTADSLHLITTLRSDLRKNFVKLVLLEIVALIAILVFIIGIYRGFIQNRVKSSLEYQTAVHYILNVPEVAAILRHTPKIDNLEFSDIVSSRTKILGSAYLKFLMRDHANNPVLIRIEVSKVADFWIVSRASVKKGADASVALPHTYGALDIWFVNFMSLKPGDRQILADWITKSSLDERIGDFVNGQHAFVKGDWLESKRIFTALESKVTSAKPAIWMFLAEVAQAQQDFQSARVMYERIFSELPQQGVLSSMTTQMVNERQSILRSNPLMRYFDGWGLAIRAAISSSAVDQLLQDHSAGVLNAAKAFAWSNRLGQSETLAVSSYWAAVHFYHQGLIEDARNALVKLLSSGAPGLDQSKHAIAYYYLGQIAAHQNRHQDSLEAFERAISYDPFNSSLRVAAMEYLMNRNYAGDLELALAIGLRGISYGIDKSMFKDLSMVISQRLGLPNKVWAID